MARLGSLFAVFLSLVVTTATPVVAQVIPGPLSQPVPFSRQMAHPLMQVQMDPNWGPVCAGIPEPGFGVAPCTVVQQELTVRQQMIGILPQLQQIGFNPMSGPICAGPLGPGPCIQVARWIAMQQVSQRQLPPLTPIGDVPGVGPICSGPLGPGPCQAVRMYLAQTTIGGLSNGLNLRQVQAVGPRGGSFGPTCDGPFGQVPCTLVGQFGLDMLNSSSIPSQASFGLPAISDPARLGAECARRSGLDIGVFVGCTGRQVILQEREQAILTCAATNTQAEAFARCAAEQSGIRLSEDQRILANCAIRAKGRAEQFAACAGSAYSNGALGPVETAVLACAASPGVTSKSFVVCAAPQFLSRQERAVLACAADSADIASFATCAAPNASIKMSDDQRILANCALRSKGDEAVFFNCAGSAFAGKALGNRERAVLGCAARAQGSTSSFAGCAANTLLAGNLSREQEIAVRCAVESGADLVSFGGCAAANMFNLQLNPEQQIAVQCLATTGGAPQVAAGCIASRLTLRELTKCLSDGIGGKGCFGDSNDLVGKNGFVLRTLGQLAGGRNSVFNNPDQIWGGSNSFVRNPGQIWGGSNSFVRNPGQIFGGPNSVFNNLGQLVPKPKPFQLGSVGGKRICLPWC